MDHPEIRSEITVWMERLKEQWALSGFDENFDGHFGGNDGTPGCDLPVERQIEIVDAFVEEHHGGNYSVMADAIRMHGLGSGIASACSEAILHEAERRFCALKEAILEAKEQIESRRGGVVTLQEGDGALGFLAHVSEKDEQVTKDVQATIYSYKSVDGGGDVDLYKLSCSKTSVYAVHRYGG